MFTLFHITKREALDAGFTHVGTLYGVPAYFAGNVQGEMVMAIPKVPLLHWYCMVAELIFDAFSYFLSADQKLMYPLKIEGPIPV
jgi:hypothetical protein